MRIFGVINLGGVKTLLTQVYGSRAVEDGRDEELSHFLSILFAAGYVNRRGTDKQYFVPKEGAASFLEIKGANLNALMMQIADYYKKHVTEAYSLLNGVRR